MTCARLFESSRGRPLVAALMLLVGASLPARAQESITVQGEILDLTCYLSKGSTGERHKTCAQMCAKKGLPLGILTAAGEVYLLIEDHDDPDPYDAVKKFAGGQAEITGKKFSKSGMASIMVLEAKGP